MGNASIIEEKCTHVPDSTHCINKVISCSGNKNVNNISEEVLNSHERQIICSKLVANSVGFKNTVFWDVFMVVSITDVFSDSILCGSS
jgi:hypothetical protein